MYAPPPASDDLALFLDFDGTLVEIAETPDAIETEAALIGSLQRLITRLDGALAIVSGRPIAEIDRYLRPLNLPCAGLHGLEARLFPGMPVERAPVRPELETLKAALAGSGLLGRGVSLEDKGAALAVHFRIAPDCEPLVWQVMSEAICDLPDLHLVRGKMVVEAKPAHRDKGWALEAFMERPPFCGRTPVFVGDDITDEDGIRAAEAIGGFGIKVGEGGSLARFRLRNVADVHRWLAQDMPASLHRRKSRP
ncbi:trehalose-phosphatase [Stappia indica]|uniref:trehalose-phosphatase n=1 Tax=Stappia indica TaxID=538381 RepID=UPI001CD7C362|nr:trehalose-phosphatase [Stappia indica]MCA1298364.1 trehalose-phosphatase [Stappia indica]